MEVHDDGRGFDLQKVQLTLGHGISNMQTRARNVGGDLEITTEPNDGTTILVWMPYIQDSEPQEKIKHDRTPQPSESRPCAVSPPTSGATANVAGLEMIIEAAGGTDSGNSAGGWLRCGDVSASHERVLRPGGGVGY